LTPSPPPLSRSRGRGESCRRELKRRRTADAGTPLAREAGEGWGRGPLAPHYRRQYRARAAAHRRLPATFNPTRARARRPSAPFHGNLCARERDGCVPNRRMPNGASGTCCARIELSDGNSAANIRLAPTSSTSSVSSAGWSSRSTDRSIGRRLATIQFATAILRRADSSCFVSGTTMSSRRPTRCSRRSRRLRFGVHPLPPRRRELKRRPNG